MLFVHHKCQLSGEIDIVHLRQGNTKSPIQIVLRRILKCQEHHKVYSHTLAIVWPILFKVLDCHAD